MKLDKNQTLFCNKINQEKINDILEEIFQKMGAFNYNKGYVPESILLSPNVYIKIKKERSNVLITKNGNDYILTMKIILDDENIMGKKLSFRDRLNLNKIFPKIDRRY